MDIQIDGSEPILIFGGPYSNLEATFAVRRIADQQGIPPDRVICTGDTVAYCAEPEKTVRLIRDWGCRVIKGNCEESLAAHATDCGCGFDEGTACDLLAKGWYAYADRKISDDSRVWMNALPDHLRFAIAGRRVCVIHGGAAERSRFIFASTPQAIKRDELSVSHADIVIAGHCGIPFIEKLGRKLWFNPGVIGMPANDGTRAGWYGLIETEECDIRFSIRRLTYDAMSAAKTLIKEGSAPAYAEALLSGLWPSLDVLPQTERAQQGSPLSERSVVLPAQANAG